MATNNAPDFNHLEGVDLEGYKKHKAPQPRVPATGQSADIHFKAVTITPEARRIARILGLRAAEYLAQRVIDAEDTIVDLVARVEKLETKRKF
jgi:hypothetical protein